MVGQQQPAGLGAAGAQEEAALTNADVIKLGQVGLGNDVVITKINSAARVAFHLGTDDLIALKNAGLSPAIIKAMMERQNGQGKNPQSAATATAPTHPVTDPSALDSAKKQCEENFGESGGFWKGKLFKTFAILPNVDRSRAIQNVAEALAAESWQNINVNKDLGLITASQGVTLSSGHVPLNVLLRNSDPNGISH